MSNNTPSLSDTTLTPDMTPVDASPGPIVDQHQPRAKKRRIKRSEETMDIPGRGSKIYTNAPIEIFLEILSYLDPLDILKISQTSKTLRGFLNDKESQYIWRQARANVPGLPPDLPVDFTEPQYAAYLFQEICQVCGGTTKKFGRIGLAALRVRLCSKCTVQHCMNAGPAAKILGGIQRLLLIPGYTPNGRLVARDSRYARDAVMNMMRRLQSITSSGGDLDAFVRERLAYMQVVEASSLQIANFFEQTREAVLAPKHDQNEDNYRDFVARLQSLGYEAEDLTFTVLQDFCYRELKKPIGACTWKFAGTKMEAFVASQKKRRLDAIFVPRNTAKLRAVFVAFYLRLPSSLEKNTFLPVLDFLQLPAVKPFLDSHDSDEEFDAAVTQALPDIEEEIHAFHAQMQSDLVDVYLAFIGSPLSAAEKGPIWCERFLLLATTLFSPEGSTSILHYSNLFERCLFSSVAAEAASPTSCDAHPTLSRNWTFYLAKLQYSPMLAKVMLRTLKQCGLPHSGVTFSQLEEHNGWRGIFSKCHLQIAYSNGDEGSDNELEMD